MTTTRTGWRFDTYPRNLSTKRSFIQASPSQRFEFTFSNVRSNFYSIRDIVTFSSYDRRNGCDKIQIRRRTWIIRIKDRRSIISDCWMNRMLSVALIAHTCIRHAAGKINFYRKREIISDPDIILINCNYAQCSPVNFTRRQKLSYSLRWDAN